MSKQDYSVGHLFGTLKAIRRFKGKVTVTVTDRPGWSTEQPKQISERLTFALNQELRNAENGLMPHDRDSDCDVDPKTLCCTICGVDHSGTCPECGGHGFHKPDCKEMVA